MDELLRFIGVRREVTDLPRINKFYEEILGQGGAPGGESPSEFSRKGWKLINKAGNCSGPYTGWITFAVENLDAFLERLDRLAIKYEELIPPWLEKGARLARFFDPQGLTLNAEESTGPTGGMDDITFGVTDLRRAVRSYIKGLKIKELRQHGIFAEMPLSEDGPVLCLLRVEKVLKPLGSLLLETDSLKDALANLEANGFRVIGSPHKQEKGGFLVHLMDEDSNPLELLALGE